MTFSGAVLTGGRSRRMGRDKAFVECGGRPLADIARTALLEAGATEVLSIGGDLDRLARLGFVAVPDDSPGEGPLGGLLTALRVAGGGWVAVLACDLPRASAATVRELLAHTGDGADAVAPLLDGRPLPTHAVWRRDCRERLGAAFGTGERRLAAALELVRVRHVTVHDPRTLVDVDTPDDLGVPPPHPDHAPRALAEAAAATVLGEGPTGRPPARRAGTNPGAGP